MAQPNGAAKVPAYLAVRYGSEFVIKSHQNGVESATRDVGASVAKEVVAASASEAVVEQASKEAASRGLADGSQGTDRAFNCESRDNWRLDDPDLAVEEVNRYRNAGGKTFIDVTTMSEVIGRDPRLMQDIARETGLNIIAGTGHYVRHAIPTRVDNQTDEDIATEMISDIEEGMDDTDIRAGIIGEIGLSTDKKNRGDTPAWMHDQEERVLRAGARAARRTGASISIHPPGERDPEFPPSERTHEVLDVCEDEGLPPARVVMGHMDQSRWVDDGLDAQRELADRGALLEYDLFDHAKYMLDAKDGQPSDWDRIDDAIALVEDGYGKNLLFSHDIYFKHWWTKYGGNGWTHILDTVLPVLQDRGVSEEIVSQIMVENPKQVLTFE